MEIGKQLKAARIASGMTQEEAAEKINMTRQTISNWENEKTYPDIISIIKLSDIYSISLDDLLKGDRKMIKHLEESTNVAKSNKRLIIVILVNIFLLILFIIFNGLIITNSYLIMGGSAIGIASTCMLFYQIIKKL